MHLHSVKHPLNTTFNYQQFRNIFYHVLNKVVQHKTGFGEWWSMNTEMVPEDYFIYSEHTQWKGLKIISNCVLMVSVCVCVFYSVCTMMNSVMHYSMHTCLSVGLSEHILQGTIGKHFTFYPVHQQHNLILELKFWNLYLVLQIKCGF